MTDSEATAARPSPVQVGEPAPQFHLPLVGSDGTVSLAEYRGRSPLFLSLFLGLWCPFCRRAIAQFATAEPKLKAAGVEMLGIVASAPHNARLYFRYRPVPLRLAADPELSTHRAYGLPKPAVTPELMKRLQATRVNPTGELPEPLPIPEASKALGRADGYAPTATDNAEMERQFPQLRGQFLIDRHGIVRWTNIEASGGLQEMGRSPTTEEMLAAVRALPS